MEFEHGPFRHVGEVKLQNCPFGLIKSVLLFPFFRRESLMCVKLRVLNKYISCVFFHLQRVISSVNDSRRALLESDRSYKNHSLQANVQNGPAPPWSPATKTTFVAFIALDASHESTRASSLRRETGLTRHAFLFTTCRK